MIALGITTEDILRLIVFNSACVRRPFTIHTLFTVLVAVPKKGCALDLLLASSQDQNKDLQPNSLTFW